MNSQTVIAFVLGCICGPVILYLVLWGASWADDRLKQRYRSQIPWDYR